jgi:epoxyqueuosine reductase
MKQQIRERALELGFDDCRFTVADPPESGTHFLEWLKQGNHGTMSWLERNAAKRLDPQQVLPGSRSLITLAASYHAAQVSGVPGDIPPGACGIIARYARFQDYHDVLAARLRELAAYVDQLGGAGVRSLWYVDTGPLLERDIAQRAGLGFVGKHTNLISRTVGNWFFLSEIITTLALDPDSPERNRCGTCTRCITACPTGAIRAPFQLDARLCISYLTIELKGSIPVELRPRVGNRVFGCDDCLAVCPWNRFAREGRLMQPFARSDLDTPRLLDLLGLDTVAFRQRFAGTPMERTRRRGLLRNVCVALGNTAGPEALPALDKAAHDPEPLIAEHALWAIEQIAARREV